jgi:hypothetical protein
MDADLTNPLRIFAIHHTRIQPKSIPKFHKLRIQPDCWLITSNGIEIGEIQLVRVEVISKREGDLNRFMGLRYLALDGLVRFPTAADAADNGSVLEVDDRDDS